MEAEARLNVSRAAVSLADDRNLAVEKRKLLTRFTELGEILEDCAVDFTGAATEQRQIFKQMQGPGMQSPSINQYNVYNALALRTMIIGTPWSREIGVDHLAPKDRRYFGRLAREWSHFQMADLNARIGDVKQQKEDA